MRHPIRVIKCEDMDCTPARASPAATRTTLETPTGRLRRWILARGILAASCLAMTVKIRGLRNHGLSINEGRPPPPV